MDPDSGSASLLTTLLFEGRFENKNSFRVLCLSPKKLVDNENYNSTIIVYAVAFIIQILDHPLDNLNNSCFRVFCYQSPILQSIYHIVNLKFCQLCGLMSQQKFFSGQIELKVSNCTKFDMKVSLLLIKILVKTLENLWKNSLSFTHSSLRNLNHCVHCVTLSDGTNSTPVQSWMPFYLNSFRIVLLFLQSRVWDERGSSVNCKCMKYRVHCKEDKERRKCEVLPGPDRATRMQQKTQLEVMIELL